MFLDISLRTLTDLRGKITITKHDGSAFKLLYFLEKQVDNLAVAMFAERRALSDTKVNKHTDRGFEQNPRYTPANNARILRAW